MNPQLERMLKELESDNRELQQKYYEAKEYAVRMEKENELLLNKVCEISIKLVDANKAVENLDSLVNRLEDELYEVRKQKEDSSLEKEFVKVIEKVFQKNGIGW